MLHFDFIKNMFFYCIALLAVRGVENSYAPVLAPVPILVPVPAVKPNR